MSAPTTMPWGKFKGQSITSLPSAYLRWLAENLDEKTPIKKAVCLSADEEYQYREKNDCHDWN